MEDDFRQRAVLEQARNKSTICVVIAGFVLRGYQGLVLGGSFFVYE